ncbi:hypothetical protein BJV82DRAFT_625197 [Fennellomyces sp. T-0311]|nr:hypothetical protein BJV82DRAFT_625197 [Fennellomyces sp. T-0311]
MAGVRLYLEYVRENASQENGKALARLWSLFDSHVDSLMNQNFNVDQIENTCSNVLPSPWDDISACHLRAIVYRDRGDYALSFQAQKELVQIFQRAMGNLMRWCLPILYTINNDLRAIATEADILDGATGEESNQRKKLEEAANVISRSFSHCVTDRNPLSISKKYGTYRMSGILFRTYFQLKQQNLCKNILRAVRAADLPSMEDFPKCDRVTYRYYLGRLHFLQEEYGKAEHELDLAFRECSNSSPKNKMLILQTLLPIRLMRGVMPSQQLLQRYPQISETYLPIVKAIKTGNIRAFMTRLQGAEHVLFRQGTYLAVEKAQNIAMRQLFRRVYLHMDQNPRIPISVFQTALNASGMEVDLAETEWMLANMIFKGYMKAYLSHEKMFAVLSKANPFPKVSTIPLQTLIQ